MHPWEKWRQDEKKAWKEHREAVADELCTVAANRGLNPIRAYVDPVHGWRVQCRQGIHSAKFHTDGSIVITRID